MLMVATNRIVGHGGIAVHVQLRPPTNYRKLCVNSSAFAHILERQLRHNVDIIKKATQLIPKYTSRGACEYGRIRTCVLFHCRVYRKRPMYHDTPNLGQGGIDNVAVHDKIRQHNQNNGE